jgi:hypothetical protein
MAAFIEVSTRVNDQTLQKALPGSDIQAATARQVLTARFTNGSRIAAVGDILVFVVFGLVGRSSHHESVSNVMGDMETILPFVACWLVGASIGGAYTRDAFKGRRGMWLVTRSWLIAGVMVLILRSLAERRVVPISFALVAILFNLLLLLVWRIALTTLRPTGDSA